MNLTVLERLLLLNILPAEGDLITLRIVRDLRSDLSFTEEEHAELQFKTEQERTTWNNTVPEKEIPLGKKARQLIEDALNARIEQKNLHQDYLTLCDKFFPEEADSD